MIVSTYCLIDLAHTEHLLPLPSCQLHQLQFLQTRRIPDPKGLHSAIRRRFGGCKGLTFGLYGGLKLADPEQAG